MYKITGFSTAYDKRYGDDGVVRLVKPIQVDKLPTEPEMREIVKKLGFPGDSYPRCQAIYLVEARD